jgi:uncharacterized protein (DUF302 family)
MNQGQPHLSFRIEEPYEVALRMVRTALVQQGARVPAELDIAARIRQEPGACVAPCTVLYVDDPAVLLEAVVFNRAAALLIPQPVVVTGNNRRTEVLVRNPELPSGDVPESLRAPLEGLRRRILRALECVGEQQGVHLAICS